MLINTTASASDKIVGIADRLLDCFDAAEFVRNAVGVPLTDADLQRYIRAGTGPVFRRWGKQRLFRKTDLLTWAADRLGPPTLAARPRGDRASRIPVSAPLLGNSRSSAPRGGLVGLREDQSR